MSGHVMTLAPAMHSGAGAGVGGNWDGDNMPCGEDWQEHGTGGHGMTLAPAMHSGASADVGGSLDWDNMPCGEDWQEHGILPSPAVGELACPSAP